MASRLGLDYHQARVTPPRSDAALAMSAILCCTNLLYGRTYPDEWPSRDLGSPDKRTARHAARYLRQVLESDVGRDAIVVVTTGYGERMAAFWREHADLPEHRGIADKLRANAYASEGIALLVAGIWPVDGYDAVLEQVRYADEHRDYDPENPKALVDLKDYSRRSRVMAEGLAVALSERFEEFEDAILGPLWHYNVMNNLLTNAATAYTIPFWSNLLSAAPVAHGDVKPPSPAHFAAAERAYNEELEDANGE
jgi:hypothetical protein